MKAQLWPLPNGTYYADFMWDDAPPGFEDHFQESMFVRRLNAGNAYAEFGRPDLSGLREHTHQAYMRYCQIDNRSICGLLTAQPLGNDGVRLIIRPTGPVRDTLINVLTHNPTGYALYMRYTTVTQDDDDEKVARIDTADVVQI